MRLHPKSLQQSGAASGQRLTYDGALWIPHGVYVYNNDESEQSTTSSSPVEALSLATGTIPAGDYSIWWNASTRNSTLGASTTIRVQVDGTDLLAVKECGAKDSSANQRQFIGGVQRVNFATETTHTIDLDFLRDSGTAYLYNTRLMVRDAFDTAVAGSPISAHRPRLKSVRQAGATADQRIRWNGSLWIPAGHYGQSEDLGRDTTTSGTFGQKMRHTTPSLVAGKYLISWHILMDRSSTSGDVGVQVELDDTDVLQGWELELPYTSTNQTTIFSGFVERTLTAAVHTIDIDFREVAGGATTGIKECWITIEQVDF